MAVGLVAQPDVLAVDGGGGRLSIGEIGDDIARITGSLPFAALQRAVAAMEQAQAVLAECAEGSSSGELLEAAALLGQGWEQATAAYRACSLVREVLGRYVAGIGAVGGGTGGEQVADSAGGDGREAPIPRGTTNRWVDPVLVAETRANGHKISAERVVRIGRDRTGRVVWLEDGDETVGLAHILSPQRVAEFRDAGVSEASIVDLVFRAATEGESIGISGRDRVVFAVDFRGQPQRVAVTVGSNGFIVGAYAVSMNRKLKPLR